MRITEKRIKKFTTEEYTLYRDEIKKFYENENIKFVKQKKFYDIQLKVKSSHPSSRILKLQLSDYVYTKINRVYWDIHSRCNNPNKDNYKYYGGRGIKNYITKEDLTALWFMDKAYLMQKPSIDREDNDGDYTFSNCQFIELAKNISKSSKKRF